MKPRTELEIFYRAQLKRKTAELRSDHHTQSPHVGAAQAAPVHNPVNPDRAGAASLCPICGAASPRHCEMREEAGGECPWELMGDDRQPVEEEFNLTGGLVF